jgi:hypothetical protein
MLIRRSPAIVLSLVLSAAALGIAPAAVARDGGTATDVQKDRDNCDRGTSSYARLKVTTLENNNYRLMVVGSVFSKDSDTWEWKMRHNGTLSDEGRGRGDNDNGLSFRISRTMINFYGDDDIVFRAENTRTGEVCRASLTF